MKITIPQLYKIADPVRISKNKRMAMAKYLLNKIDGEENFYSWEVEALLKVVAELMCCWLKTEYDEHDYPRFTIRGIGDKKGYFIEVKDAYELTWQVAFIKEAE